MLLTEAEMAVGFPVHLPRMQVRELPISGDFTMNKIHIDRSTIGVLNAGGVITNLDSAVTVLGEQGQTELAAALTRFTEEIAKSNDLQTDKQKQILEVLSVLSNEVAAPREARRQGVVRPLLGEISTLVQGTAALHELWGPLKDLFGSVFGT